MSFHWLKSVAADRFDDEFVVAQLTTGLYFSIRGSIVELLDALPFSDFDAALSAWQSRTGAGQEEKEQVKTLWQELLQEDLVASSIDVEAPAAGMSDFVLRKRMPSEMSRYGDMQDLLALDIIHEVDEQGWPEEGQIRPATELASDDKGASSK
ncbi:MAG: hypothetical protein ACPGYK_07740 [Flavobacteriales bacterium]